jgi:hypothetical protein
LKLAARRRQDDGDGRCSSHAHIEVPFGDREATLHARLSHRHARLHGQGPPARPAAQRPGQLLRCDLTYTRPVNGATAVFDALHELRLKACHRRRSRAST